MNKALTLVLVSLKLYCVTGCSQTELAKDEKSCNSFSKSFNSKFNDPNLLIALQVFNATDYQYDFIYDKGKFISISRDVQEANISISNVDSLIDIASKSNNQIIITSDSVKFILNSFARCLKLTDLVFSEIESDEDLQQMKALEQRLFKFPELKKIYLLYLDGRPNFSSLSSGEGIAMNIHFAYFLFLQDEIRMKTILKELL